MEDLARRLREAATDTGMGYPTELLVEASRALDQLQTAGYVKRDNDVATERMFLDGTWLVEITADCTCGSMGQRHNSLCGVKTIIDISTINGFEELVEDVRN